MPLNYETEVYTDTSRSGNFITGISKAVKWLLIVNTAVFLLYSFGSSYEMVNPQWVVNTFGQVNADIASHFTIWQFLTSMFMHGNILHLVNNMLLLWVFGTMIEQEWNSLRFIKYYFVCGLGSGVLQFLISPHSAIPGIGASGAIFGLLGGAIMLFPDRDVYLFMVRVKLKYVVAFLTLLELCFAFTGTQDGIGHWVHISGFVIGVLYIKIGKAMYEKKASANMKKGQRPGSGRFDNIEI